MQSLRHLVVVVPGIGGSVLSDPTGHTTWATDARRLGGLLVDPARLDLDRSPDLAPTALIRSFTALGALTLLRGYDGIERNLRRTFRNPVVHTYRRDITVPRDIDVLLFPYDFRHSIRASAEALDDAVAAALDGVVASARRRRIVIVAHSLGGLVARYWLGPLGRARLCAALLTLGTPHRGAPKALDWLVNGAGTGRLRHPGVTQAVRGWPSVYELLPQYPAVWEARSGRETEFTAIPDEMLQRAPRLSSYRAEFARRAANGRQTHDDIAEAWAALPPDEVPIVPWFGRGHPTGNRLELTAAGELAMSTADPVWRGNVGWRGDGTVPALSAIPRELGERRELWRGVTERHLDLAGTDAVLDVLMSYSGDAVPTRGTTRDPRPWLGLDVPDAAPSGEPITIGAVLQPEGLDADSVHMSVTGPGSRPDGHGLRLGRHGDGWRGALPTLPEGRHRVTLEARGIDGRESVFAGADFVVMDAEQPLHADAATVPGNDAPNRAITGR